MTVRRGFQNLGCFGVKSRWSHVLQMYNSVSVVTMGIKEKSGGVVLCSGRQGKGKMRKGIRLEEQEVKLCNN